MKTTNYRFNFEQIHHCLMRYYKSRDEKDFTMFVKTGVRQFIVLIARKTLREFKRELVKDLDQEVANMVLLKLMKPRKKPITNIKSYLYTAAINTSYNLIKKYNLYEYENRLSFDHKEYKIESPEYTLNPLEKMNINYERLLQYFTQQMQPTLMKPWQAYVFMEHIKGYSCKEIAQHVPGRKFKTIKSDLRDARMVLRTNGISKETILKVLE